MGYEEVEQFANIILSGLSSVDAGSVLGLSLANLDGDIQIRGGDIHIQGNRVTISENSQIRSESLFSDEVVDYSPA